MTENYQPTNQEIKGGMYKGIRERFNTENITDISSRIETSLKYFGKGLLRHTITMGSYIWALPTAIRRLDSQEAGRDIPSEYQDTYHSGALLGIVVGTTALLAEGYGLGWLIKEGYWVAGLVPATTQLISGYHELKTWARNRLRERQEAQGVETLLETTPE